MGSFVGDSLRLQEGGDLGLDHVAIGLLKEEDAIGEVLVVGTDLRVDVFVSTEISLGCENHCDQRELGLVDRERFCAGMCRSSRDKGPQEAGRCLRRTRVWTCKRSDNDRSSKAGNRR